MFLMTSWNGECGEVPSVAKKSKLRYQKELEKFTSERKTMSESEVKRNLHPLVTMDTDSHSRE
jgi:hypothetical protein